MVSSVFRMQSIIRLRIRTTSISTRSEALNKFPHLCEPQFPHLFPFLSCEFTSLPRQLTLKEQAPNAAAGERLYS